MPTMTRIPLQVLWFALLCASAFASPASAGDDLLRHLPAGASALREAPTTDALRNEIVVRSAQLFDAIFRTCMPDTVADAVTGDFEFHHDRGGTIATTRAGFVDRIRGQCERRRTGDDAGSRRELVAGTQAVFPVGDGGAIETGIHRFHVPDKAGGETLVGIARYSHLWRREDGVWRVARILSYDHRAVH
jgi:hypothetical protein